MTKTRIDSHWVISGDNAQRILEAQGYKPRFKRRQRGKTWILMSKEIKNDNKKPSKV